MDLKDIPKITELSNQLTAINKELAAINKIATLISDGNAISSFELKVVDKTKPEPNTKAVRNNFMDIFGGSGLIPMPIFEIIQEEGGQTTLRDMSSKFKPPSKENELTLNLIDTDVLIILAGLVAKKHLKQTEILTQLKNLGVKEKKQKSL